MLKKLIITVAIGIGCLTLGIIYYRLTSDQIFLILSLIIFAHNAIQSSLLYRIIIKKNYQYYSGICLDIKFKPWAKYQKATFCGDDGQEMTLLLARRSKIKVGNYYGFYFKQAANLSLGNDYLDASLAGGYLLAYQQLAQSD